MPLHSEFDAVPLHNTSTVQVLGVNRAASRETCIQASEKLLGNVPEVGYSQDLILSRALALEATTSVLLDYTTRRAYDRSPHIEVPYTDMPGAAHLLCTMTAPHSRLATVMGAFPAAARQLCASSDVRCCSYSLIVPVGHQVLRLTISLHSCRGVCTHAGGWGCAARHQVGARMAGGQQL